MRVLLERPSSPTQAAVGSGAAAPASKAGLHLQAGQRLRCTSSFTFGAGRPMNTTAAAGSCPAAAGRGVLEVTAAEKSSLARV